MTLPISILKNRYPNQVAHIIGKGLSIAVLSRNDINDGPVIALNDSILFVENLNLNNDVYSMQKDGCGIKEPHKICNPILHVPKKAALIMHELESSECMVDYEPRYIFNNNIDFRLTQDAFSAMSAFYIARLMGCNKIIFLCFDSKALNNTIDWYMIKKEVGFTNANMIKQTKRFDAFLRYQNIEIKWTIPRAYNRDIHNQDFFKKRLAECL
jgi:hypothetical protein